jgi:hypothetical protein
MNYNEQKRHEAKQAGAIDSPVAGMSWNSGDLFVPGGLGDAAVAAGVGRVEGAPVTSPSTFGSGLTSAPDCRTSRSGRHMNGSDIVGRGK